MKASIFAAIIEIMFKILTPDLMKKFADLVLDFAEDFVVGTKSDVDDKLVLPLCSLIRTTFDIPDND